MVLGSWAAGAVSLRACRPASADVGVAAVSIHPGFMEEAMTPSGPEIWKAVLTEEAKNH